MRQINSISTPIKRVNAHFKTVSSDASTLQPGVIYHIYNRGVNGETIFREKRNYEYFVNLYVRHIQPVAETYTFCLMPNHFHLLTEIKDLTGLKPASQAFSNLFNAYAKAVNKAYGRTGPLFERPFKRIPVTDSNYFARLLIYIHQNPERHGLIGDYRNWPYSSYGTFIGEQATFVKRDVVMKWFGDVGQFLNAHRTRLEVDTIKEIVDGE